MAKLISVSAYVLPIEGVLAASGQRLINVDKILGVKASPSAGALLISGVNSAIEYSYNVGNMIQSGTIFVGEAVSTILAAASA